MVKMKNLTIHKKNIPKAFIPFLFAIAVFLFLLPGCKDPHQQIREFDHNNITSLELFIEQEERWVRAIYSMDSTKAASSVDSIRELTATPWMEEKFLDLQLSPEFGNYVNTSLLFWSILSVQADSVYQQTTISAFSPQNAYSKEEEQKLMDKLGGHDRTMQKLLDSIRDLREEVSEKIY